MKNAFTLKFLQTNPSPSLLRDWNSVHTLSVIDTSMAQYNEAHYNESLFERIIFDITGSSWLKAHCYEAPSYRVELL